MARLVSRKRCECLLAKAGPKKVCFGGVKKKHVSPHPLLPSPLFLSLFYSFCRYQEGDGAFPKSGDDISAHYTGRLLDGTEFDSSRKRPGTFNFVLGQGRVIQGWDKGFATMKKGEKAFLTCGPTYAYGEGGSPPLIPPSATLRFEVELVGFGSKADQAEEAKAEGNRHFTKGDLELAEEAYSRAWSNASQLFGAPHAALKCAIKSNLAACALKRGDSAAAAKHAAEAVAADASNAKAQFRLGSASLALGKVDVAKKALVAAAKLAPSDAAVAKELEKLKALVRQNKAASDNIWKGLFNSKGKELGIGGGESSSGGGGAAASAGSGGGVPLPETDSEEEEEEIPGLGEAPAAAAPAAAPAAPGEEKLDD
jgi:hypothetical protein